jgi:hypothetical protein
VLSLIGALATPAERRSDVVELRHPCVYGHVARIENRVWMVSTPSNHAGSARMVATVVGLQIEFAILAVCGSIKDLVIRY